MKRTERRFRIARATALFALVCASARAQSVWYVDAQAPPGGSGASWIDAFDELGPALDVAAAGDEVWVADGTYRPSPGGSADPRGWTFRIPRGVRVYGGFAGGEPSLEKRAGLFDATLLDGDIGIEGDASDNCFHVVRVNHGGFVKLDGFTIQNGNAVGSAPVSRGAAVAINLSSRVSLFNCTLRANAAHEGAAVSVMNLSVVALKSCVVEGNVAEQNGGGLYCRTALVTSVNTLWHDNKSKGDGGAVFVTSTNVGGGNDMVRFFNDVFRDNAAVRGGALAIAGSELVKGGLAATLCTIAFNRADSGGGIFAETTTPAKAQLRLINSIVWSNSALSKPQIAGQGATMEVVYSDIAGGFFGAGNIASDPRFVDPSTRDLRLLAGSPANDAGHTGLVPGDLLDIDGDGVLNERLPLDFGKTRRLTFDALARDVGVPVKKLPIVDMGAFEL